jgi:hypothetical protein
MTYIPNKEAFAEKKQLAQAELTNSPVSYYSPAANIETSIDSIIITNTTNVDRWFILWVDDNGTTYNDTTVLYFEVEVPRNTSMELDKKIYMNDSTGNLAMEAEINSALTATIFGIEYDLS